MFNSGRSRIWKYTSLNAVVAAAVFRKATRGRRSPARSYSRRLRTSPRRAVGPCGSRPCPANSWTVSIGKGRFRRRVVVEPDAVEEDPPADGHRRLGCGLFLFSASLSAAFWRPFRVPRPERPGPLRLAVRSPVVLRTVDRRGGAAAVAACGKTIASPDGWMSWAFAPVDRMAAKRSGQAGTPLATASMHADISAETNR